MPLLSSFSSAQFSSTQLGRGNAPLFSLCHELSLHLHESTKWSSKDSFDDPCLPTTVQRIEFHKVESTMNKKPTQSPLHTVASIDDAIARYHSITLLQQPTVFFSIYQNDTWIIRCLVDEMMDPATQCIIVKIVRFLVWFIKPWKRDENSVNPSASFGIANSCGWVVRN